MVLVTATRGEPAPLFNGVGVALATLFRDTGEVDARATADHAARLVDLGVRSVVVAGSTGEASALDADERRALLDAVRAAVADVPVLAGTGGAWAGVAARQTAAARDAGADAVLVLSPPRVNDPSEYYAEVAKEAGELPVLAYHFPTVSPPGIPVELLPGLPISGCKDSSGDPERLLRTLATFAGWVYVGSSAILSFAGPLGCPGAILALANAEPALTAQAFTGDPDAQRRLLSAHLRAQEQFPRGLKALMAERFGTATAARLG